MSPSGFFILATFVKLMNDVNRNNIFTINNASDFKELALETYRYQYKNCAIYQSFCKLLNKKPENLTNWKEIPYLPISFFKSHKIVSSNQAAELVFESSGTTADRTSKHFVTDIKLYEESFLKGFEHSYGKVNDFCILALLPSYLERKGSSLIFMVNDLIKRSGHPQSGFYKYDYESLARTLNALEAQKTKSLLIGVSFALLDFVEANPMKLSHCTIMETGGMKGRKKEIIREELHNRLKKGFGVHEIHSEYGMTELLSQAYSTGNGLFKSPPWMKVLTRDTEDPLQLQQHNKTGGINVIDLANQNSCSFIATQDLGKTHADGSFEILGRFDHSDVRGCNLMAI